MQVATVKRRDCNSVPTLAFFPVGGLRLVRKGIVGNARVALPARRVIGLTQGLQALQQLARSGQERSHCVYQASQIGVLLARRFRKVLVPRTASVIHWFPSAIFRYAAPLPRHMPNPRSRRNGAAPVGFRRSAILRLQQEAGLTGRMAPASVASQRVRPLRPGQLRSRPAGRCPPFPTPPTSRRRRRYRAAPAAPEPRLRRRQ